MGIQKKIYQEKVKGKPVCCYLYRQRRIERSTFPESSGGC